MNLDLTNLPTQLETLEDYELTMRKFMLPFFHEQANKLVNIIHAMHEAMDNNEINEEDITFYMNQIKEVSAFANESSPMYPYMQAVVQLERKLADSGAFNEA